MNIHRHARMTVRGRALLVERVGAQGWPVAQAATAAGDTIVEAKTLIPDVGCLLSFKDTEGNVFAILEPVDGNPFAGG